MKKLIASSIIGLGLASSLSAADCIMVPDLNVEFKNDSTVYMNNEERQEVVEFAKFLKKSGLYAIVEGHTSKFASAMYNYDLSQRRAVKVRTELIALGVNPKQIKGMGFGESSPLYDNNTEIGAQKNRRVIAEVFNNSSELISYASSEKARISKIKYQEQ
ncbi:OmpA family protein [Arcobacter sp. LA11]|uniref:OmpA family protein n=1 Tax=Arcobacter sp. LA11 TaxID=1898176 RepID=UPI0009322398|nr:OmpA family protein [Arcobacter sp. LA11]